MFVLSQWAQDPARSEEDLFNEFAEKRLKLRGDDIHLFRELCLLSAQGVLRGQYSLLGGVSLGWNRDQYMGGLAQLGGNFNSFVEQGQVEDVLAEKEEAVTLWRRMETLSKQINVPDKSTKKFIETSCTYGRIKYEIIAKGWAVMLLGMAGDKAGQYDEPRMGASIASYDQLWEEWKQLEASSPSCATIYTNHYCRYVSQQGMFSAPGMSDSVNIYRHIVSDGPGIAHGSNAN